MKDLFYPRSVAVIGVSEVASNVGRMLFDNLTGFGFAGPVYAVGKKGGTIGDREGKQAIYQSILAVPGPVDLASILVPAAAVLDMLEECGQKGVQWVVIMSSGFAELSDDRQDVERTIREIANRHHMHIVGPNCLGNFCAQSRLYNLFTALPVNNLRTGGFSIAAQSGSVAQEVLILLSANRVGISKGLSIGNKTATDEVDVLNYLVNHDQDTTAIMLYLESINNGRGLYEAAKNSKKPIVLFKANIVPGGSIAAKSHTAALATDDSLVEAVCRQTSIVRAHTYDQFYNFAKALAMPPVKGNNAGVIVCSGGAGVVLADQCYLHGFNLPSLPADLLAKIEAMTRTRAILRGNPLDLGDTYDRPLVILKAIEAMLQVPELDVVFAAMVNNKLMEDPDLPALELYRQIWQLSQQYQKPVAIGFQPLLEPLDKLRFDLEFPVFDRPEESVEALAAARDYWRRRARPIEAPRKFPVEQATVAEIIARTQLEGRSDLSSETSAILRAYGVPFEAPELATSRTDAVAVAERLGYPVVLKIASPQISHKTDVGGVALNLENREAVADAFERIIKSAQTQRPDAQIQGVTVQKMVGGGQEVIVGARRDPQFGPVVMFGLGGVFVELLKDISFRLAPLTEGDAREMIEEVKAAQLLRGFRGQPPADTEALIETLQRVSQLMVDCPQISEMDINPLKVFAKGAGCLGVDARMSI